jgi:hypothetical protein
MDKKSRILLLLLTVLILPAIACSVIIKSPFYQPLITEKWLYIWPEPRKIDELPQLVEYRCKDTKLLLSRTHTEEVIAFGPPLLPIIPIGMLGSSPSSNQVRINVITQGTRDNPTFDRDTFSLRLSNGILLKAYEIDSTRCHNYGTDSGLLWYCSYLYYFQMSLAQEESFDVLFNHQFNNCDIPAIYYKKKDNMMFYPFIIPFTGLLSK